MSFNFLNDKKLLSLNQKEQLQPYIRTKEPESIKNAKGEDIKKLFEDWNKLKDQKNNLPKEF